MGLSSLEMSKGYLVISYSLHCNIIIMMSHKNLRKFELFNQSFEHNTFQDIQTSSLQILFFDYPSQSISSWALHKQATSQILIILIQISSEFLSNRIIVIMSQSINIITSNMTTTLIPSLKVIHQTQLIEINDSPSQLPSLFDQLIAEYTFYDSLQADQGSSTPIYSMEESSGLEWSNNLETEDISVEKVMNEITRIDEEDKTSNDDHDSIEKLPPLLPKVRRPKQKKSHQRVYKEKHSSLPEEKESTEVQPQKSKKIIKAARMILQPFWSFSWNLLGSS